MLANNTTFYRGIIARVGADTHNALSARARSKLARFEEEVDPPCTPLSTVRREIPRRRNAAVAMDDRLQWALMELIQAIYFGLE
jgi:hypothetical protein